MERAVRLSNTGAEIALAGGMCEDRHVTDFLLCVQCWLGRTYGDPRSSGRPFRLKRLDLSKNSLSDQSICDVLECMKRIDLRVERVFLAGNSIQARGMSALTEYLWNCKDALVELDLSDTGVSNDVHTGEAISALFRCLYNHSSYPVVMQQEQPRRVLPITMRLAGNYIQHTGSLIEDILKKGIKDGRQLIRVCSGPDSYVQSHEEFLSMYLPDISHQQVPNAEPAALPPTQPALEASNAGIRLRSRSRRRRRRKEAPEVAPTPAPVPAPTPAPAPAEVPPQPERQRRRKKHTEPVEAPANGMANAPADDAPPLLSEEEQRQLQGDVAKKLNKIQGLPSDQATCDMLSEFTVCMFVARKAASEVEVELASFLGEENAGPVANWFAKHVRKHYKNAAKEAGWA